MTYEILRERLTELESTLLRVDLPQFHDDGTDTDGTLGSFVDINLDQLDSRLKKEVWIYLEGAIASEARALATQSRDLRKRLEGFDIADPRAAADPAIWNDYIKLNAQSQTVVRDFVELLTGLAFRDRSNESWIFDAVDQLIVEYAAAARQQWEPLSVPWVQDAIVKTLARVMRLRFQDWTIWGIPMTAFEFWRVLLESDSRPSQIQNLLDHIGRQLHGSSRLTTTDRVLVADALATYMMGVSYASAAIVLRFERVENNRAWMVLQALELIGRRDGSDAGGVYDDDFVGPLRKWWEGLHGGDSWPDAQSKDRVEALARVTLEALRLQIPSTSYRADNLDDRLRPVAAYIGQGRSYPVNGSVEMEKLTLRDVMNIAWVARVKFPNTSPRAIAKPAIELCRQALNRRPRDRRSKSSGGSSGRTGSLF